MKENRLAGFEWFVKQFLSGSRHALDMSTMRQNNNLTTNQCAALSRLAADKIIVIKASDKCGKIVIIDVKDYDEACLQVLTNKEHYTELQTDPNPRFKEEILVEINTMKNSDPINKFEEAMLTEVSRTPVFYGSPKLHKSFTVFPVFGQSVVVLVLATNIYQNI